ncbi:hypothetical protein D3C87_1184420 [compost metagenome]
MHVDAAADAGAGRGHAVDEGVRAFEHFHTLQGIGGNDLPRQDAVQAIEGNIVAVEGQAADHEGLRLVGKPGGLTHRRIVEQHITDVFGLLVANQFFGVGGDAEGHVHDVLVAQHTQLPAPCDLPPGIHRRQIRWHRGFGVDVDIAQHQRFSFGWFGRCRIGRHGH